MIRSSVILVLLDLFIQTHADPGRIHHDFYQPSNPKSSHGSHWGDWGWDQQNGFNVPRTTQRIRTRKTTTNELKATASTFTSRPAAETTHPQPVIRDAEITIKEDPTDGVSSATPTRISPVAGGSALSDVTPTDYKSVTSDTPDTQTDMSGDVPFNIRVEIPFPSTEVKQAIYSTTTNFQERPSSTMTPGSPSVKMAGLNTPGIGDLEMSSHWHVGIYRTTEMPYTQICGGSLVKTDKVISAGHCFWTVETNLQPANQFAAAAGKIYRAWDDPRDLNAQYSDIKDIVTTRMFQPCLVPDLALLTLATPFRYVGAVKPVCLELAEKENLTTGDSGLIAGWGVAADACKPSERLIWSALPFVHTLTCSPETERFDGWADKICVGDAKSKTQCDTDSGSGLVFFNSATPYLRGVATFVADHKLCFTFSTPSFTSTGLVFDEYDQYFEMQLKNVSSTECRDFYSVTGQFQSENQSATSLNSLGGQLQIPSNVGDATQIGQNQNVTSGFNFTLLPGEENIIFNALGTGSTPVPTLGNTSAPAYEWHVGIYSKVFTPFMQICGGSLVKLDVVISAAHCFWEDSAGRLPAARFAVAGGKLHRPWNSTQDTFAQFSDVSEIIIPIRFRGETTSFQDDIAVVRLSAPFALAPGARPACVDFDEALERRQLVKGTPGTVAGWGLTQQNGSPSQRLNYLELPYVDIGDCYNTSEASFLKYITSDKICAGNQFTGKALCRGDSGGGLILFSGTTPYLRGVASTAPNNNNLCNAFAIATFTQINAHRTFLRDNIPDIGKGCMDPTGNGAESGAATGNGAESGPAAGNGAERLQFTIGNGMNAGADRLETGNRVVTTTENSFKLKPPAFVTVEGPTATAKPKATSTSTPFEHSHLVPYNNFNCNCNCKT